MPRSQIEELFRGYRFGLIIPGVEGMHGVVSVQSETHAVHGEVVRVATGHLLNRRPLAAHLVERREIEVWSPIRGAARRFLVHYESAVWHPLNFDAGKSTPAFEVVLLLKPSISIVDVPAAECPPELRQWVDPPKPPAHPETKPAPAERHVCGMLCDDPCEDARRRDREQG